MEPVFANPLFGQLVLLADCLCEQIVASGAPETCFCGIVPGDAAVAEYGGDCSKKCGVAWIRLASVYPSVSIGQPYDEPKNCAAGLGATIEVGIMRCTPVGTGDQPPSPNQLLDATELQMVDATTMRRAVVCCPGSDDMILGTYTPLGPAGGMLGGAWSLSVWVP